MIVKAELLKLGLHYLSVDLGEIETMETLTAQQLIDFSKALQRSGLELMDDKKSILIESAQFKKITGLTPSFFKKLKYKRTTQLENL